jgi:hypothetical protein
MAQKQRKKQYTDIWSMEGNLITITKYKRSGRREMGRPRKRWRDHQVPYPVSDEEKEYDEPSRRTAISYSSLRLGSWSSGM